MIPKDPDTITEEQREKFGRDGNPGTPKDVMGLPKPRKYIDVKEYAERYDKESLLEQRDFQAERYKYHKEALEEGDIKPKHTEQHYINTMCQAEHLMDQLDDAMREAGYFRC